MDVRTKKRRETEIYENYWKFTAAYTDIMGPGFYRCLSVILFFIDENRSELEENARQRRDFSGSDLYRRLQKLIVQVSGFQGKDPTASARKAIRAYTGIYSQLFGKTDIAMDRPLSAFMSEYEYSNLVYNQGILLFDSLREAIGEKRFMSGLQEYYRKYSGKIASPEALISCFERTGVDVRGHFSSFLEGNAVI